MSLIADLMSQIYLGGSECCGVERSDRLGFVNEGASGALGYQFRSSGVDNWFAQAPHNISLLPAIDDVVTFDTLSFPYAFALTAAYDTGEMSVLIDNSNVSYHAESMIVISVVYVGYA